MMRPHLEEVEQLTDDDGDDDDYYYDDEDKYCDGDDDEDGDKVYGDKNSNNTFRWFKHLSTNIASSSAGLRR